MRRQSLTTEASKGTPVASRGKAQEGQKVKRAILFAVDLVAHLVVYSGILILVWVLLGAMFGIAWTAANAVFVRLA